MAKFKDANLRWASLVNATPADVDLIVAVLSRTILPSGAPLHVQT